MSSYATLSIDTLELLYHRNGVEPELYAVFRDEMHLEYEIVAEDESAERHTTIVEFRCEARTVAMRLDAMGIDEHCVRNKLDEQYRSRAPQDFSFFPVDSPEKARARIDYEEAVRRDLDAEGWIRLFRSAAPTSRTAGFEKPVGSISWLLDEVENWDSCSLLRLVLVAMTDADEVVLDITDLVGGGWMDPADVRDRPSEALQKVRAATSLHAPLVVLTEGRTDAEFLSCGLGILFPFLSDLVRFLDYDYKPEGSASALARLVKSFAAGIANRVVAVFDNDAAAADAQRALKDVALPPNIRVINYPHLEFATSYPTLGPPALQAPTGALTAADVNGLAASIELYLGRDVLAPPGSPLQPVQWKAFLPGPARYQGEIVGKDEVHRRFRAKCAAALEDPECIAGQDWEGIRMILADILAAFATPPAEAAHVADGARPDFVVSQGSVM